MLFPVHRFSTDSEGRVRLVRVDGARTWQRVIVVPAAWCVHETVPARSVRPWEQRGFAQLQARRLAPFPATGGSAVVRGGQLHLWLWDQAEVDSALAGVDAPLRSARRIAEGRMPASASGLGPWTTDLLSQRAAPSEGGVLRWATAAAVAGLLATGAYAAHAWGLVNGAERQLARLQAQASERGEKVQALSALSRAEQADRDWLDAYARAGASLDVLGLLRALTPAMESHGVALREIEVRQDDVRLLLVSAGIEIDLPALMRSVARVPGVADVQLRQNVDISQATISLRADAYYTAPRLRTAGATVAAR
jgi:hypothetical protein